MALPYPVNTDYFGLSSDYQCLTLPYLVNSDYFGLSIDCRCSALPYLVNTDYFGLSNDYQCLTLPYLVNIDYFGLSIDCRCSTLPYLLVGGQWLSGRVLDSRPRARGMETHRRDCVVSLSKNINPSLVLVQPMKTHPFITERLLMGCKESNQTNKQNLT